MKTQYRSFHMYSISSSFKKTRMPLVALLLFAPPCLMGAEAEFSHLTINSAGLAAPANNGDILVNGNPGTQAAITINAITTAGFDGFPTPLWSINSPAVIRFNMDGKRRWALRKTYDQETGSQYGVVNSGSDFEIERFSDAGDHLLPNPLKITRADNTITIAGSLVSTHECAAGYKRVGPNSCLTESASVQVFDTSMNCTQSAALFGVTTAKAVIAEVLLEVTSKNDSGLRQATVRNYSQNCAAVLGESTIAAYEFTNIPGNLTISKTSETKIIPSNEFGQFFAATENVSSGTGFVARYTVIGYYD